jgi:protein-histidine pros-kinase
LPGPEFFPQSIPFYASTENFNYFRGQNPDYSYEEAALNPTNPRDRTVDWEADVVNIFRNDHARTEVTGHRDTADGASLYFCAPILVEDATCLTCHSAPETAPVEMVKKYGTTNGFAWKLNEVIGAQIVSIPAKLAHASAERALRAILLWLGGILGFVLVAANIIGLLFFGRSSSTLTCLRIQKEIMHPKF